LNFPETLRKSDDAVWLMIGNGEKGRGSERAFILSDSQPWEQFAAWALKTWTAPSGINSAESGEE
jgi:hypothetical protein